MARVMTATEARVHFGELLRIVGTGEHVIVERYGKPVAVFLSPDEYQRLVERYNARKLAESKRLDGISLIST